MSDGTNMNGDIKHQGDVLKNVAFNGPPQHITSYIRTKMRLARAKKDLWPREEKGGGERFSKISVS